MFFTWDMFILTPLCWSAELVSFTGSLLRLSNHLLTRSPSLVSSDASVDLFLHRCHCGFPSCFIIRRCGGDVDKITDPFVFCRPMILFFPADCMLTAMFIFWFWGFIILLYFGDFFMLSFSLEQTKNFTIGTFAPRWLHHGSYNFSPPVAQQCQVGPYACFPIPFNWTSCFVVSAVSGYLGFSSRHVYILR